MRVLSIAVLLLTCVACGGGERSRATPVPVPAPVTTPVPETAAPTTAVAHVRAEPAASDDFVAPDANGWGTAAGLHVLEVVRGAAATDDALPMIVVLHGLGDRPHPEWIRDLPVPVRLVLPQAPTPYEDGFAWFPFRSAEMRPGELARGIASAAERLARAITVWRAHRPTHGEVLVTGFSQGGMLSYALALRHPEQVALAVPISGLLPEELWPKERAREVRYPPIRAMHGDADERVPIALARSLVARLAELGFDASLEEHPGIGHGITPAMFESLRNSLAGVLASGTTR